MIDFGVKTRSSALISRLLTQNNWLMFQVGGNIRAIAYRPFSVEHFLKSKVARIAQAGRAYNFLVNHPT
jgi:hypothetical protein